VVQQQTEVHTIGGSAEPVTLRFQNTRLKQVFEILARTANIDILFDKDVRDDLVTIFTKDTPFDEALNLILSTNQLFSKRVGPDRLLIIPDTKQKRDQYEDLQIRTFYLSHSKAKDMANLLRTILETKRVYVNEPLNTVVVRDQPAKITLAQQIISANDRADSEVLFEVEVLEVDRTDSQNLGLQFAKSAGFGIFPPGAAPTEPESVADLIFNILPPTWTFRELTSIGQDSYLFTFPSSVLLNFFKQNSEAKTLASPKIRVLNNEKASINVGDKVPILLSTTNVLPGQAATGAVGTTSTVTSIEFKIRGSNSRLNQRFT
jgi:general secretion pathway protein D